MTVINPPVWLNAASASYTADDQRRLIDALLGGRSGILYPGDLAPTQRPTPDMQVRIAGGRAFIINSLNTVAGTYMVDNQGDTDVTILASEANPRYDRIIAEVRDAEYAGAVNDWRLHVVKGTAAATPTEPALTTFNNYIEIARVTVGANVTSITNANILDRRITSTKGQAAALGGKIVTTSAAVPTANLYEGVNVYQTDTNYDMIHNGTALMGSGAFTAPQPQTYGVPSTQATNGGGFVSSLSVPNAIVAPYPLRMYIRTSGNCGFASSGVARGIMRIVDPAVTVLYSSAGGYLGGNAAGEMAIDVSSPYIAAYVQVGWVDLAAGATGGFIFQHACTSGPNFYVGGMAEVWFQPRVSG